VSESASARRFFTDDQLRREIADLRRELEAREGTIAGLRYRLDALTTLPKGRLRPQFPAGSA
jgi:hypothetical protein